MLVEENEASVGYLPVLWNRGRFTEDFRALGTGHQPAGFAKNIDRTRERVDTAQIFQRAIDPPIRISSQEFIHHVKRRPRGEIDGQLLQHGDKAV